MLVLTVDVPVAGVRNRDVYNGLTLPPTLTPRTILGMASKPRWLFDALTTEPLAFESLGAAENVMELFNTVFDPSVTTVDLEWLRSEWSGSIVVKGIAWTMRGTPSRLGRTVLRSPTTADVSWIEP